MAFNYQRPFSVAYGTWESYVQCCGRHRAMLERCGLIRASANRIASFLTQDADHAQCFGSVSCVESWTSHIYSLKAILNIFLLLIKKVFTNEEINSI